MLFFCKVGNKLKKWLETSPDFPPACGENIMAEFSFLVNCFFKLLPKRFWSVTAKQSCSISLKKLEAGKK